MVKPKYMIFALLCIGVAIILVIKFMPDDKKVIRRRFADISACFAKNDDEGQLGGLTKAKSLSEFLSEPSELESNIPMLAGKFNRQEAAILAVTIRDRFSSVKLDFHDLEIDFPDESTASVTLTAKLGGVLVHGELASEVRELKCDLVKVENKWLIRKCKVVEVLQN